MTRECATCQGTGFAPASPCLDCAEPLGARDYSAHNAAVIRDYVDALAARGPSGHVWYEAEKWLACVRCGVIRHADNKNNRCVGWVGIVLRGSG